MAESSQNHQKTLLEKEKLLVKSNFSFSHRVFKRLVLQTRKNQDLFGKGLKPFITQFQVLDNLRKRPFVNIVGKGGLLGPHFTCHLQILGGWTS